MAGSDRRGLAFDFAASVRSRDADNRLHIASTNLCMGDRIDAYLGGEIPGWEALGLDADKLYAMLRPASALKAALATFANLPVLLGHYPVTAADPKPELIVGATGSDPEWRAPYVRGSMVIWSGSGIAAIESSEAKMISPGYRYSPSMRAGTFNGEPYDGVMESVVASHIALVAEARQGSTMVVADSARPLTRAEDFAKRYPQSTRIRSLPW